MYYHNPAFDFPEEFDIIIPRKTEKRLKTTCYRDAAKAGCFAYYRNSYDLFGDPITQDLVEEAASEIIDEMDNEGETKGLHSFTVVYPNPIGWSSTTSLAQVEGVALVQKKLNRRAHAMFVADPTVPAPETRLVTFVAEVVYDMEDWKWKVITHSIYPGPDIGQLYGDMTDREGVVFFDWDTPGEI